MLTDDQIELLSTLTPLSAHSGQSAMSRADNIRSDGYRHDTHCHHSDSTSCLSVTVDSKKWL